MFVCEYAEPYTGRSYGLLVHAPDEATCNRVLRQLDLQIRLIGRGKGNDSGDQHRIHTWAMKSQKLFVKQLPKILHHISFVAHMTSRWNDGAHAGLLVSDTGIIHSIAHLMLMPDEPGIHFETRRDVIVGKVSSYERFVPWLWPGEERDI